MKMEREDEQNKEKKESITALGERDGRRERKKEVKEMSNREKKMERSTGRFSSVNYYECYSHTKFLASFEISMSSD